MILPPDSEEKSTFVKSPLRDERSSFPDQSPPPYSPFPKVFEKPPLPANLPRELAPMNYTHVKGKNDTVKRKVLLDLSVPRPPASSLPVLGENTPNLVLDSYNGTIHGEVWLLSANREHNASDEDRRSTRERAHLHFRTNNGIIEALLHVHPWTVEPRPFLNIDVRTYNGIIAVAIPRSFRGQLTFHTGHGDIHLSPALAPRATLLSVLKGTHTYFVGERPSCGKWHTGEGKDGDEVDKLNATSNNGSIKVSYDDEDVSTKGPGVLSSLFKAIGF